MQAAIGYQPARSGGAGSPGISAVLDVLEVLDRNGPTTLAELARETGIAKSTLHRVCSIMFARGWAARDPRTGHIELGPRVVWLGHTAPVSPLTAGFHDVARRLVARHNETTCLTVLDGRESVFIAKEDTTHQVRLVTAVGSRLPAFAAASGRVLLADRSEDEVAALYAGCELVTPTGRRLDGLHELFEILRESRRRGYAENIDETALGLHCLAVPVGPPGRVAAAITLCVPSGRMSAAREREMLPDLLRAADEIVPQSGDGEHASAANTSVNQSGKLATHRRVDPERSRTAPARHEQKGGSMSRSNSELDRLRSGRSELENHYIDELASGSLSRRDFMRRGAVIGMSAPLLGAIVAACGGANNTSATSSGTGTGTGAAPAAGTPKKGGTLKVATQAPSAAVNPLTVADSGGLAMLNQTGEFLTFDNNLKLMLEPMLALSWSPNSDGSVWTFKLRPGVTFHNGQAMTADDVVYSWTQYSDKKNASSALSAIGGVLLPSGVKKVDHMTVAFHLEAPNGNFPYLVSSDTYNAIIVPNGTDFSKWQSTFLGTGAFKLKSYTQNVGAEFVANPSHWGGGPYLDGTNFTFYTSQPPQILALQGGQVDVITQFVVQGAQGLLNNSSFTIITLKSSNHRELSMRNDQAPFTDARVRQAVALTMDRTGMVAALLAGKGVLGNDSAFAPVFPSTDTSVPQRTQNISMAKQLLSAAGHPNGFSTSLVTEIYEEIPQLAQVMKANMAKVGINASLKVETQTQYYGTSKVGNSDWLDSTMSLVDYGSRGVPNVLLTSTLTSTGTWNAARFKNPTYDNLVKQYVAAVDLQTQKQIAGKIQTLLLQETPIVIPYFIDGLTASKSNIFGLNPTSISQIYLDKAYIA